MKSLTKGSGTSKGSQNKLGCFIGISNYQCLSCLTKIGNLESEKMLLLDVAKLYTKSDVNLIFMITNYFVHTLIVLVEIIVNPTDAAMVAQ
jgi:hypothetical protein